MGCPDALISYSRRSACAATGQSRCGVRREVRNLSAIRAAADERHAALAGDVPSLKAPSPLASSLCQRSPTQLLDMRRCVQIMNGQETGKQAIWNSGSLQGIDLLPRRIHSQTGKAHTNHDTSEIHHHCHWGMGGIRIHCDHAGRAAPSPFTSRANPVKRLAFAIIAGLIGLFLSGMATALLHSIGFPVPIYIPVCFTILFVIAGACSRIAVINFFIDSLVQILFH